MMRQLLFTLAALAAALLPTSLTAQQKPLKVYILAGQSNMEGHAQTRTLPAVAADPTTAALHAKIVDESGEARVHDDVWVSYAYGDYGGEPVGRRTGQLTTGFGSQHHMGTGKIGPELTFGITMHELHGEPILLIKNAWGGKSLLVDFRPPIGGELPDDHKAKDKAGRFYREMIDHVRDVLADPKAVYPGYDARQGFELAGFVWFQGFNDLVGPYPPVDPAQGRRSVKDYSEYSRLMACFIRDVRRDLEAPELPFVIGVLGTGGPDAGDNAAAFRAAMAAPAAMDEFQGNVAAVHTHEYWPTELDAVKAKADAATKPFAARAKELKQLEGSERKQAQAQLEADQRAAIEAALSEDELFQLDVGISNQGFHYWGSAKFFARVGEAFARAMVRLER